MINKMTINKEKSRPVIYQLLPRLFGNRNLNRVKNGSIVENGCGKFNDITPLALQRIRELGITHVWYTGVIEHAHLTYYSEFGIPEDFSDVVKGRAGSPYAIKDYFDVDPDLAVSVSNRMDEFEALVQRTHQAHMKVIIDLVPNHLARQYISDKKPPGVSDFGANDNLEAAFSPRNNFYYLPGESFVSPIKTEGGQQWLEKPARVTGNDCFTSRPSESDWYETVKLNYGVDFKLNKGFFDPVPDTWVKMREVVLYWAEKGVDAFRCDMAGMVPIEFWQWLFNEVRGPFPKLQFIAEIYESHRYQEFIFKAGFDYLYDKEIFYNTIREILAGNSPAKNLKKCWQVAEAFHHKMLYFHENPDEERIASDFFAGNSLNALPAVVLMTTMLQNAVMVYFGQELGERGMDEEGFSGVDGRTSIFDYWGLPLLQRWVNNGQFDGAQLSKEAHGLRNFYGRLLAMVNGEPALRYGKFYDLTWSNEGNPAFAGNVIYAFFRYCDEQLLLILANFSDRDIDYRLHVPRHFFELAGFKDHLYFTGNDKLEMNKMIQFPGEVALNAGIGGRIKGHSASVYELMYPEARH
jgi:glycosidase